MEEIIANWPALATIFGGLASAIGGFLGAVFFYGEKIGTLKSNHDRNVEKIDEMKKTIANLETTIGILEQKLIDKDKEFEQKMAEKDKRIEELEKNMMIFAEQFKNNDKLAELIKINTEQILQITKKSSL